MTAAGKKEFRSANENSACTVGDSSAPSDLVSISQTVVPLHVVG